MSAAPLSVRLALPCLRAAHDGLVDRHTEIGGSIAGGALPLLIDGHVVLSTIEVQRRADVKTHIRDSGSRFHSGTHAPDTGNIADQLRAAGLHAAVDALEGIIAARRASPIAGAAPIGHIRPEEAVADDGAIAVSHTLRLDTTPRGIKSRSGTGSYSIAHNLVARFTGIRDNGPNGQGGEIHLLVPFRWRRERTGKF